MSLLTEKEIARLFELNLKKPQLSTMELARLESGRPDAVSISLLVKARRILDNDNGIQTVSRAELDLLVEEHNNLATKTMLIYEALVQQGLLSEEMLAAIAEGIRTGGQDGTTGNPTGGTGSPGSWAEEDPEIDPSFGGTKPRGPRVRRGDGPRPIAKKGGASNAR